MRRLTTALAWVGAVVAAACSSASGGSNYGNGAAASSGTGATGFGGFGGAAAAGGAVFDGGGAGGSGGGFNDCGNGTEWIYLVNSANAFLRFRPDALAIDKLGTLACPGASLDSPFSMSVQRNGVAWVLFQSGNMYHVDVNSVACTATSYPPSQQGLTQFGMGFVSDGANLPSETLFVAGGTAVGVGQNATLARIDTQSLGLTTIGNVSGWPELTGTGLADLWGFSPNTTPPSIIKIDKASGAALETHPLTTLNAANFEAWAFAFWGGSFYIFLKTLLDPSTIVWKYDPATQQLTQAIANSGYRVVGAGVSTCAPIVPPS